MTKRPNLRASHGVPLIVIVNGPFGSGKSTVAKLLRKELPGSAIYDPEWAGSLLMRASKLIRFNGAGTDDFQDIRRWRKITIAGIRLFSRFATGHVIAPMAFTNLAYLREITDGLNSSGPAVKLFCLKASETTLNKRLAARGVDPASRDGAWIRRRNIECAEAHQDPSFGESIETEYRTASEVAAVILKVLDQPRI